MDPFAELNYTVNVLAEAVIEGFVKASLIAGCIGLTIVCGIALLARRKSG